MIFDLVVPQLMSSMCCSLCMCKCRNFKVYSSIFFVLSLYYWWMQYMECGEWGCPYCCTKPCEKRACRLTCVSDFRQEWRGYVESLLYHILYQSFHSIFSNRYKSLKYFRYYHKRQYIPKNCDFFHIRRFDHASCHLLTDPLLPFDS